MKDNKLPGIKTLLIPQVIEKNRFFLTIDIDPLCLNMPGFNKALEITLMKYNKEESK